MSRGFEYELDAYSETRHAIEARELLGMPVTFALVQENTGTETAGLRYFNGHVCALKTLGRSHNGQRSHYGLRLVPWLWFLGKQRDCRVFQNKTVIELLQAVFEPLGSVARARFDGITGVHPEHRYLVQFNETALSFVSRWLRREGIAYYITHRDGAHTVHFIDDGNIVPALEPGELVLHPGTPAHDHLTHWQDDAAFVSGAYGQASYNYNHPNQPLGARTQAPQAITDVALAKDLECYQYTTAGETPAQASVDSLRRMRQGVAGHRVAAGRGCYRCLKPGHHFSARQAAAGEWHNNGRSFTLTRISLLVDNAGDPGHGVHFEAIPKGELVYPEGSWPVISSLQTAVVTGPRGSQGTVYSDHAEDRLGRVKVHLHWDRHGPQDDNSSCWLRVMQHSAGNQVSAFYALPRVGDEVVVAFENGNPDRPFILGALPTPLRQPPFAATPSRCGIRTQSFDSNGPAPGKWNELRFDDSKGNEEIHIRAERNLAVHTRHDETRLVDHDLTSRVTQDAIHTVGGELTMQAGGCMELRVGGSSIRIAPDGIRITAANVEINGRQVKLY